MMAPLGMARTTREELTAFCRTLAEMRYQSPGCRAIGATLSWTASCPALISPSVPRRNQARRRPADTPSIREKLFALGRVTIRMNQASQVAFPTVLPAHNPLTGVGVLVIENQPAIPVFQRMLRSRAVILG